MAIRGSQTTKEPKDPQLAITEIHWPLEADTIFRTPRGPAKAGERALLTYMFQSKEDSPQPDQFETCVTHGMYGSVGGEG